jgi:hypothetical protein
VLSLEMYDLQQSLLDSFIVRQVFALTILIFSSFDCEGLDKNFFSALFLFLIVDLQSSMNHGFSLSFSLPQVFCIDLLAMSINVEVNCLKGLSDLFRTDEFRFLEQRSRNKPQSTRLSCQRLQSSTA